MGKQYDLITLEDILCIHFSSLNLLKARYITSELLETQMADQVHHEIPFPCLLPCDVTCKPNCACCWCQSGATSKVDVDGIISFAL